MNIPSLLPILIFTLAASAQETPSDGESPKTGKRVMLEVSEEDEKLTELRSRDSKMKHGISVSGIVDPSIAEQFQRDEAERGEKYDALFNKPGAYKAAREYQRLCFEPRCNLTMTQKLFEGAKDYVKLEKEVEDGLDNKSEKYKAGYGKIRGDIRSTLKAITPKKGSSEALEEKFGEAVQPVITKFFTPDEQVEYMKENAANTGTSTGQSNLGDTYNNQGSHRQARQAYDVALGKDPRNADALRGRGQASLELGEYRDAVTNSQAALAINPNDPVAHATYMLAKGRIPAGAGNAPSALGAGGLGGKTASPGAAAGMSGFSPAGEAFSGLSRSGSAPGLDMVRQAKGLVANAGQSLNRGDSRSAIKLLKQAMRIDPRNARALTMASIAYARMGNYGEALRMAQAGLELSPDNLNLLTAQAFAQNRLKDYAGALKSASAALKINPKSPDAMAQYAHALGGVGRHAEMMSYLEQAAAIDPRYASSAESAKNMPPDSDMLFLFPGESRRSVAALSGPAETPAKGKALSPFAVAGLVGGFLAALLMLKALAGPLLVKKTAEKLAAPVKLPAPSGQAGDILRGKYEIVRRIGTGGMGIVFEGNDASLARPVAIKKMREELRLDSRERRRFLDEAKTVASLHHPNIVDIYDIFEEGGDVFLIFEFVGGKTVDAIIARKGALNFNETLGIAKGMVQALEFAHGKGIIHRDLKPSNIMVSTDGQIKVMDFGIARLVKDAATHSMTNTVVGTPPYMAPEQEQGLVRKEGDVYSLAVCVYEMLAGELPFAGSGAGMLMNKINMIYTPVSEAGGGSLKGLDEVFARAFQADPDKRYKSPNEFYAALKAHRTASA